MSYDLQIERLIDAPPGIVLAAWGSADRVREWFTPKPLATGECRVDFRPGGEWVHEMVLPDGRAHTMHARYIRIEAPDRLVFEATIAGMEPSVILTTVTLEDERGKTRLRVHQVFDGEIAPRRGAGGMDADARPVGGVGVAPYLIRMLPEAVEILTRGPPPRTLPASLCLSIDPTIVTGWADDTEPELEWASTSNAASGGSATSTLPDAAFTVQGPAGRPSTSMPPLPVLMRAGPFTPVTLIEPDPAVTDTSPGPVCVTVMLPEPLWAESGPAIAIARIEPLPVCASRLAAASTSIPPDPLFRVHGALHRADVDGAGAVAGGHLRVGGHGHVVADRDVARQVMVGEVADPDGVALLRDGRVLLDLPNPRLDVARGEPAVSRAEPRRDLHGARHAGMDPDPA